VLNSSFIWERKGYDGSARTQLERWSKTQPIINQLLMLKPRWGFSFSIDWIGSDGDVFEILDYGFSGSNLDETEDMRSCCEESFLSMDWDKVALQLQKRIDQWIDLDQHAQLIWKCDYLGVKRPGIKRTVWS